MLTIKHLDLVKNKRVFCVRPCYLLKLWKILIFWWHLAFDQVTIYNIWLWFWCWISTVVFLCLLIKLWQKSWQSLKVRVCWIERVVFNNFYILIWKSWCSFELSWILATNRTMQSLWKPFQVKVKTDLTSAWLISYLQYIFYTFYILQYKRKLPNEQPCWSGVKFRSSGNEWVHPIWHSRAYFQRVRKDHSELFSSAVVAV